jgi:DNA-directed RNA polymerase subunit RPC12/RpoP
MATVIKLGKFQKECFNCKSTIEFEGHELKSESHTDYKSDTDYYRYLICPSCGYKMRFPRYTV